MSVQVWRLATLGCLQSMGSRQAGGMESGTSGPSGTITVKEMRTLRSNLTPRSPRGSKVVKSVTQGLLSGMIQAAVVKTSRVIKPPIQRCSQVHATLPHGLFAGIL